MIKRSLQDLFCQQFKCSPAEFETEALKRCLYGHARLTFPLLRGAPKLLADDARFIRRLGQVTDAAEAYAEVLGFQNDNQFQRSFLRNSLRLRVSGRRAHALARALFLSVSATEQSRIDSKALSFRPAEVT